MQMTSDEILAKLVGFDTTSRNSNLQLIDFVEDYLNACGVKSTRIPSEDGTKANLFAKIGPDATGGIALSGHTDVVPVDGQDWHSDPFTLTQKEGRYYGRGSCDMKGFLASSLYLVPEMVKAPLTRPIYLVFSFDEEVAMLGIPLVIEKFGHDLPKPDIVIVGEPSMMKVVSAQKGIMMFKIVGRGYEAHSSLPQTGASAVTAVARVVNKIHLMAEEAKIRAPSPSHFNPPYTTLHVGMINGGTAGNIIARDCTAVCDIRYIPEDDPYQLKADLNEWIEQEINPPMQAIDPACGVKLVGIHHAPALEPRLDSDAETLARTLTGDNDKQFVSYATEAGHFQNAGTSVVICGPGSIEQAHQPDEYLDISQLKQCDKFLHQLVHHLSV